jgi:hypothetical protein
MADPREEQVEAVALALSRASGYKVTEAGRTLDAWGIPMVAWEAHARKLAIAALDAARSTQPEGPGESEQGERWVIQGDSIDRILMPVEEAEAALAQEREKNAELREALEPFMAAYRVGLEVARADFERATAASGDGDET